MDVSVPVFQAIAGFLPAEILDRSVERMNFQFVYVYRACSLVFQVTEHDSDNPCAAPLERLLNFYSLATVAKMQGATPSDTVTIPVETFGQIRSFLAEYVKTHADVDRVVVDFVSVDGGQMYTNPMSAVVELTTSPV